MANLSLISIFHRMKPLQLITTGNSIVHKLQHRHSSTVPQSSTIRRIYEGPLTGKIRRIKIFSLSTSVFGIAAQPIIYNELSHIQSTSLIVGVCSVVGFFTFVNPFLLHFVTKKYITKLDYNSEKNSYIATYINFLCMQKQIEFTPDDVVVPDVPGMFTTLHVKGMPIFFEARLFDDPGHYARIMGYDKPMNFKLYETSTNESRSDKS